MFKIPWLFAVCGGSTNRNGVNTVRVTITIAVVHLFATVPRCPDEDAAFSFTALYGNEKRNHSFSLKVY